MGNTLVLFKKGNYVDNPYNNFFEINARDINKNITSMKEYNKKVILVVNVSPFDKDSKSEFEKLNKLKESLGDGFEILAFPSGEIDRINVSDNEMKEAILAKKFIDTNKIKVYNRVYFNGSETCEVLKYCLRNSNFFRMREGTSKFLEKNFVKFLIDKKGKVYSQYLPDLDIEEIIVDARKLLMEENQVLNMATSIELIL